jgi:hydroxyacylglutathione hydrolase
VCFSGDTLFNGGIGRTDLWGGDMETLVASIKHRLYNLNGAVEVVPGHGPSTTIDREKRANPFVRA